MAKDKKMDVAEIFTVHKMTLNNKQYSLRPWNFLQVEELAEKVANLYDSIKEKAPGIEFTDASLRENAGVLVRTLPRPVGDIIWRTFKTDENEETYGGEIDHSFLKYFDVVTVLEATLVIVKQNVMNENLVTKVGELIGELLGTQAK